MCGIAGVVGFAQDCPASSLELGAMLGQMVHRGPDDAGTYLAPHVALGMRRLAIIDVAGGHQPMTNEDGTVWVVLNGEIYNYRELRDRLAQQGHRFASQCDTEALVHAYEEYGDACVDRLNGMFAFALWDGRRERLLLARDRAGIKPLHYLEREGRLAFGSELKALLALPWVPRALDPAALQEYLLYEHVPGPRTIFRGIRKLPPGYLLTYDRSGLRLRQYWDFDLAQSEAALARPVAEWRAAFLEALERAVRMEMVSDVPLGVFLSGGIDSSAVTVMAARALPQVKTFSIAFEDPTFDESRYARLVARHLGTDHHELTLAPRQMWELVPGIMDILDEPLGDSSLIPTYLLSRFARESVTVALGGDGGDELLAGYSTLQAHRLAGAYRLLPAGLRQRVIRPLVERLPVSMNNLSLDFRAKRFVAGAEAPAPDRHHRWLGSFTPEELALLVRPEVRQAANGATGSPYHAAEALFAACRAGDELNRVLYLDMKLYLDTDILTKVDRASMACSLETRVPLLNAVMLDLAARMPLDLKLRGLTRKFILREAMKGMLPQEILARGKKGFNIPVAKWFRGELRPLLLDTLAPDKLRREGLFHPEYVQGLISEHLAGVRDHRKLLWTLLVFELWYDRYLAPERT
ncbi:MAG: asparagine synthase (glutamine-hydrolyzing) [Chloroflexi bacterium]|nr:asparagine synthase (glutamine-hydrolyzing) [Chloroflexota bacterium]